VHAYTGRSEHQYQRYFQYRNKRPDERHDNILWYQYNLVYGDPDDQWFAAHGVFDSARPAFRERLEAVVTQGDFTA